MTTRVIKSSLIRCSLGGFEDDFLRNATTLCGINNSRLVEKKSTASFAKTQVVFERRGAVFPPRAV